MGIGPQNRSELERLFEDCQAGRIDLVLMKSISRLSRNTLNASTIFNHLFDRDIELRFELENLSSKDKRVRQMFAMIATIAQEKSWSKSENIKWGMRHKAKQFLITAGFLAIQKIVPDSWSSWKARPRLSGLFTLYTSLEWDLGKLRST